MSHSLAVLPRLAKELGISQNCLSSWTKKQHSSASGLSVDMGSFWVTHLLPRRLTSTIIHSHTSVLAFRVVTESVMGRAHIISVVYRASLPGIWKGQWNPTSLQSSVFQTSDHWINICLTLWAASGVCLWAVQRKEYLVSRRGHCLSKGSYNGEITSWKRLAIVHWMCWTVPRGNVFPPPQLETRRCNLCCGRFPH